MRDVVCRFCLRVEIFLHGEIVLSESSMNGTSTWTPGGGEETLQEKVLMGKIRGKLHIVQGLSLVVWAASVYSRSMKVNIVMVLYSRTFVFDGCQHLPHTTPRSESEG
jgi:hypothetical protein